MRVLVWKNDPADRRSVAPSTRSSSQSRPQTTRVGWPAVVSATPALTAWSTPTTSGCAPASRPATASIAASAPSAVTSVTSTWPVATPSRTTTWRRAPAWARWS